LTETNPSAQVVERETRRVFRERAVRRVRPDRGIGQTPAGVLVPDDYVVSIGLRRVPQILEVNGRERVWPGGRTVHVQRVCHRHRGMRVRDRMQRDRRRVRRDQSAHRSRHGHHAFRRNPLAVQRPLPARPARPIVQRPVRRGHVPDHVEPDACPDEHNERLRVHFPKR